VCCSKREGTPKADSRRRRPVRGPRAEPEAGAIIGVCSCYPSAAAAAIPLSSHLRSELNRQAGRRRRGPVRGRLATLLSKPRHSEAVLYLVMTHRARLVACEIDMPPARMAWGRPTGPMPRTIATRCLFSLQPSSACTSWSCRRNSSSSACPSASCCTSLRSTS